MAEEDEGFGLPDELDVEADLRRAEQRLTVRVETRRYGKAMTVVDGFDESIIDVKSVASDLKRKLGVGGTVDDGSIELQGDHRDRLPNLLRDMGFQVGP